MLFKKLDEVAEKRQNERIKAANQIVAEYFSAAERKKLYPIVNTELHLVNSLLTYKVSIVFIAAQVVALYVPCFAKVKLFYQKPIKRKLLGVLGLSTINSSALLGYSCYTMLEELNKPENFHYFKSIQDYESLYKDYEKIAEIETEIRIRAIRANWEKVEDYLVNDGSEKEKDKWENGRLEKIPQNRIDQQIENDKNPVDVENETLGLEEYEEQLSHVDKNEEPILPTYSQEELKDIKTYEQDSKWEDPYDKSKK